MVTLIILDGWGLSPSWGGNALMMNNPKNIDAFWKNYPHKVLQALGAIDSGNVVGESRLGHLMIGAGRQVTSPHSRINQAIRDRQFFRNPTLIEAFNHAKKNKANVHLMGLISDGGVHADVSHLLALLDLAFRQDFNNVYIDAITDGTDSDATSALKFVEKIQHKIQDIKLGQFSSVAGRAYAMDRNEHWDKIKKYYLAITSDQGPVGARIEKIISESYRQGLTDNGIVPALISDRNGRINPIKAGDSVIFFNFREDRARQITQVFLDPKFGSLFWKPKKIPNLYFSTFTNYLNSLPAKVVFANEIYPKNLSETVSKANFKQLKIAESEKYAHVSYFFNGGKEAAYAQEERKIISSPNVASYDQKPAMSAKMITATALNAIREKKYDLIVINYANVDMVAHTGNILAVGEAVQTLDKEVAKIVAANLAQGGATIITADHGNAEQMVSIKGGEKMPEKEVVHTLNPVPFILIRKEDKKDLIKTSLSYGPNALSKIISAKDTLADIAPTILELMGLPKPPEMTGHSLLHRLE